MIPAILITVGVLFGVLLVYEASVRKRLRKEFIAETLELIRSEYVGVITDAQAYYAYATLSDKWNLYKGWRVSAYEEAVRLGLGEWLVAHPKPAWTYLEGAVARSVLEEIANG